MPDEPDNLPPTDRESDDEARRWEPPLGGDWFYRMRIDLDHAEPMEFSATVPGNLESADFATAVVNRIGGPSARDWEFRRRLYFWVGLITVAGGKIEAGMKRALLAAESSSKGDFAEVDETWTRLEKDLRKLGEQQVESPTVAEGWGQGILSVLDWGTEHRVKERRDSAVHAYWWDWADTNVTRGRFYRSGESTHLVGDFDTLQNDGETLLTYADMVESLAGPRWLNAHLPRENPEGEEPYQPPFSWVRKEMPEP